MKRAIICQRYFALDYSTVLTQIDQTGRVSRITNLSLNVQMFFLKQLNIPIYHSMPCLCIILIKIHQILSTGNVSSPSHPPAGFLAGLLFFKHV